MYVFRLLTKKKYTNHKAICFVMFQIGEIKFWIYGNSGKKFQNKRFNIQIKKLKKNLDYFV